MMYLILLPVLIPKYNSYSLLIGCGVSTDSDKRMCSVFSFYEADRGAPVAAFQLLVEVECL